jgi:hypothetical protein
MARLAAINNLIPRLSRQGGHTRFAASQRG